MTYDAGARNLIAGVRDMAASYTGNRGLRLIPGRVFNAAYSGAATEELLINLAATDITAIRVWFVSGYAASAVAVTMNGYVRSVPDTSDAASNSARTKRMQTGGSDTWTHAVAAASNRRLLYPSDWMSVRSVPRTDGGSGSLYAIRTYRTAGQVIVSGNGSDSFANQATNPNGRIWRQRVLGGGDYTAASWNAFAASAVTASGGVIAGIEYIANGKIVNLVGFGDSITEGRGTYLGDGFGVPAAIALTQESNAGTVYEWSNLGWSGQTMYSISQNVIDALTQGIAPNIAVIPNGSPNDSGNAAITQDILEGVQGALLANSWGITGSYGRMKQALSAAKIPTITWTWLPTNTAVANYGSSDSLRTGWNARTVAAGAMGEPVADFSAALSGVTTGGQVQMLAGSTTDNIHPNDSGNTVLAGILKRATQKLIYPMRGFVVQ